MITVIVLRRTTKGHGHVDLKSCRLARNPVDVLFLRLWPMLGIDRATWLLCYFYLTEDRIIDVPAREQRPLHPHGNEALRHKKSRPGFPGETRLISALAAKDLIRQLRYSRLAHDPLQHLVGVFRGSLHNHKLVRRPKSNR